MTEELNADVNSVEYKVRQIIAGELIRPITDILPETNLHLEKGFLLDSLDMITIAMHIEETFDFEVKDEEIEKWSTVGSIIYYVNNKLTERKK